MDWIKSHKKAIGSLLTIIIASSLYAYDFHSKNPNIPEAAAKIVNPPTSKEEDLRDVSQKLTTILGDLRGLKQQVDAKMTVNTTSILFGINNPELSRWEISVSGKNTLHLVEGDKVLLINNRTPQKQAAQFTVKFVRQAKEEDKPEMYINSSSAEFFGIVNPEQVGAFDLTVQKIN